MDTIPIRPERKADLEKFAIEHGQSPADALDEAIASWLSWQKQDFEEAVEGIRRGAEDVKAGRTVSLAEFDEHMRRKYDIPR